MAIRVKRVSTWKKQDVKYHFSDGTKLIHDSKRYYIDYKAPENEVDIDYTNFKTNNTIGYKFKDRGSEPPRQINSDESYTHAYAGNTIMPKTGMPKVGWQITKPKTPTKYGAGSLADYTLAQKGLAKGEKISQSALNTAILVSNPKWREWSDKGDGTTHTKSPERTEKFIKREKRLGRLK